MHIKISADRPQPHETRQQDQCCLYLGEREAVGGPRTAAFFVGNRKESFRPVLEKYENAKTPRLKIAAPAALLVPAASCRLPGRAGVLDH